MRDFLRALVLSLGVGLFLHVAFRPPAPPPWWTFNGDLRSLKHRGTALVNRDTRSLDYYAETVATRGPIMPRSGAPGGDGIVYVYEVPPEAARVVVYASGGAGGGSGGEGYGEVGQSACVPEGVKNCGGWR